MEVDPNENPSKNDADDLRAARGELRHFLRSQELRRRQLPRAILVGLIAGLIAVAFRWSLELVESKRIAFTAWTHHVPLGWLLLVVTAAVLGGAATWLVRRIAPEAAGSGIPHLKAVLHRLRPLNWKRVIPVKFAGGLAGLGAGLTLGREGPTVQMGGAVGAWISDWVGATATERQTLIAAGAGAGLSAAFNAPLAGVVFVLEEVQRDFAPNVFSAALVASITADVVTRALHGELPVFHVGALSSPALSTLPAFLVLGLAAALLGVSFNKCLLKSLDLFRKMSKLPPWASGAAAAATIASIGWFSISVTGSGQALTESALSGRGALDGLALLFALRFGAVMISYGSGAPGGIFAPLLVLGSQLGLAVGLLASPWLPGVSESLPTFAAVGMAAFFSAIVRAPLTGIVLLLEMTGSYSLMLPALLACMTAYGIADLLGDRPIYEALLGRDLLRGEEASPDTGTLVIEVAIEAGSPFEGRSVAQLGLPAGCLLISRKHGTTEEIPIASTVIRGGDRLTAVVSARAGNAVAVLKDGGRRTSSNRLGRRR